MSLHFRMSSFNLTENQGKSTPYTGVIRLRFDRSEKSICRPDLRPLATTTVFDRLSGETSFNLTSYNWEEK